MKIQPTTKLGNLSVRLILVFLLIFMLTNVVVIGLFKQEGGDTFFDNLYISIPMLAAFIVAFVAFVTGLTSVLRDKERALAIIVPIILGLSVTMFLIAELASPH